MNCENRQEVSARHREEWKPLRNLINEMVATQDMELAKTVKAMADAIKVYQEGERKAYDFSDEYASHDDGLQISWEQ